MKNIKTEVIVPVAPRELTPEEWRQYNARKSLKSYLKRRQENAEFLERRRERERFNYTKKKLEKLKAEETKKTGN